MTFSFPLSSRFLIAGLSLLLLGCQSTFDSQKTPGSASSVPVLSYPGHLTLSERETGVVVLWAEIKRSFAYFESQPDLDWDHLLQEYLPRAGKVQSDWDYYLLMMRMAAQLKDGLTRVIPPDSLLREKAIVPLKLTWVRNKVVVLGPLQAQAELQSIVRGSLMLSVDGIPVETLMARYRSLVSASTEEARRLALLRFLSLGPARSYAMVQFQSPDGTVYLQRIRRTFPLFGNLDPGKPMEARLITPHVAYVAIRSFQEARVLPAFEAFFTHLALPKIHGFILDLRGNSGGDSKLGYAILSHFFQKTIQGSRALARLDIPVIRGYLQFMPSLDTNLIRITGRNVYGDPIKIFADHSGEMWMALPPITIDPKAPLYTGPLAVLIDHRTANAAEDVLVALDASKRATLIGQTTAGSTGQPVLVPLPGGGKGLICAKKDTYPDGTEFVGIGIRPNLPVEPTLQDIIAGRDPVLDEAVRWIRQKTKSQEHGKK